MKDRIEVTARFDKYRDKTDPTGCWPWVGSSGARGYGHLSVDGKHVRANRLAWELENGPIPAGKVVRHSCDNKVCTNPAHLLIGTLADNSADMVARGRNKDGTARRAAWKRARTHCYRGHSYADDGFSIEANGVRRCLRCAREQRRAQRRAKQEATNGDDPIAD